MNPRSFFAVCFFVYLNIALASFAWFQNQSGGVKTLLLLIAAAVPIGCALGVWVSGEQAHALQADARAGADAAARVALPAAQPTQAAQPPTAPTQAAQPPTAPTQAERAIPATTPMVHAAQPATGSADAPPASAAGAEARGSRTPVGPISAITSDTRRTTPELLPTSVSDVVDPDAPRGGAAPAETSSRTPEAPIEISKLILVSRNQEAEALLAAERDQPEAEGEAPDEGEDEEPPSEGATMVADLSLLEAAAGQRRTPGVDETHGDKNDWKRQIAGLHLSFSSPHRNGPSGASGGGASAPPEPDAPNPERSYPVLSPPSSDTGVVDAASELSGLRARPQTMSGARSLSTPSLNPSTRSSLRLPVGAPSDEPTHPALNRRRVAARSDDASTDEQILKLFNDYVAALEQCGQAGRRVDYEAFARRIRAERRRVRQRYETHEIHMSVKIKEGRPKVIISPRRGAS